MEEKGENEGSFGGVDVPVKEEEMGEEKAAVVEETRV